MKEIWTFEDVVEAEVEDSVGQVFRTSRATHLDVRCIPARARGIARFEPMVLG